MRTAVINNCAMVSARLPPPPKKEKAGVATDGTLIPPTLGELVQFIPGLNLIDSEKLKALRQNKTFDGMFSTRIEKSAAPEHDPEKVGRPMLEVDKSVGKDGEVNDLMPLDKLPHAQCKAMISEMLDLGTLRQWSKEETRGEIRREIEAQIDHLSVGDGRAKTAAVPGR